MFMKDNQGNPLEQREELTNVREMYFNMDCTTVPIRPVRWRVHHPWFAPIQEAQKTVLITVSVEEIQVESFLSRRRESSDPAGNDSGMNLNPSWSPKMSFNLDSEAAIGMSS